MDTKRAFVADIGASGGKCFVGTFGDDVFSIQEIHRFSHDAVSFYLEEKNGEITERMYWDDTLIYQNLIRGLQKYHREVSDRLEAIGIDTWGTDGCFITEKGDLLGKVFCYRDHRLDNMVDEVKKKIDAKKLYEITGIHFWPFNLDNQLLWFITHRKELFHKGCSFLPMPSLFYFYLGGVKKIDSTWASVTQLMDAHRGCWSDEIFKKLDIPISIMPEIVAPGTIIGQLSKHLAWCLGLNQSKLVAVGSHDTASAYAAAPVDNQDDALIISSGTWSLVGKLLPKPITNDRAMKAHISNEGGIGNIRFLKNCMGTWIVQELRKVWKVSDGKELSWEEITRLVEKAPAFTSFIDPDDSGFYNPSNMKHAIADFCKKTGQKVPKNRGTYLRVVYESLAMKYRMVNEQISKVCAQPSRVIHIVGGGSKNELLNQFTSDATGLPVIAGPDEATAVGNIMVQAMGLGIISNLQVAIPLIRQVFKIKNFTPENKMLWEKQYLLFKKTTMKTVE